MPIFISYCLSCKWLKSEDVRGGALDCGCKAFPDGIPIAVFWGRSRHDKKVKGQVGDWVWEAETAEMKRKMVALGTWPTKKRRRAKALAHYEAETGGIVVLYYDKDGLLTAGPKGAVRKVVWDWNNKQRTEWRVGSFLSGKTSKRRNKRE